MTKSRENQKKQVLLLLNGDTEEQKHTLHFLRYLRTEEKCELNAAMIVREEKRGRTELLLKKNGYAHVGLVVFGSRKYRQLMRRADYLLGARLPNDYSKGDNQIFVCVCSEASRRLAAKADRRNLFGETGVVIRNLISCDYLYFPGKASEQVLDAMDILHSCTPEIFNGTGPKNIIDSIILKSVLPKTIRVSGDDKKNVVIFAGGLEQNGITTALLSQLRYMDLKKDRFFIALRKSFFAGKEHLLDCLPEDTILIPLLEDMQPDLFLGGELFLYYKRGVKTTYMIDRMRQAFSMEWKKHFGEMKFDHAIHYSGYGRYATSLFMAAPCPRSIWVHNDMQKEIALKGKVNPYLLQDAYCSFDHVVIVSEDLRESVEKIAGKRASICTISNIHDDREVLRKSLLPITFDGETQSTISLEELEHVLKEKNKRKFINIGRYSPEKGHERLIRAFERFHEQHPDSCLIIIGGAGSDYEKTVAYARGTKAASDIHLLKQLSNPMPILKQCDGFLLSSFYEGLGLVLLEADTLGIPTAACDVSGPAGFMREHGGTLLENSEEGIYEGFCRFARGEISAMRVDYESMNRENVEKIYKLIYTEEK